jgi:hypothetical protein
MKEIKNFAILNGNAEIKNGIIIFKKAQNEDAKKTALRNNELGTCEIRSDADFYNGDIGFKVKFKDNECGCVLVLNSIDNNSAISIGASSVYKQFVILNENGYITVGKLSNYDLTKELQFRIEVKGSVVKLFINNVLLGQGNYTVQNSPITFILSRTKSNFTM